MGNETIEEAVSFIETAASNIKEALKHDAPRDGITLEELMQLLDGSGNHVKLRLPMNGRVWETKITVMSNVLNGTTTKSTDSFRDPGLILSMTVRRISVDNDLLCVDLDGVPTVKVENEIGTFK